MSEVKLPIVCKLPDGFLKSETRDGFVVTEKLKQVWAVEIDLYFQFAAICERHGIKYQIFGGSLLGAVRHKGFIPWDDDLDVAMTRDQFEKFIRIAPTELEEPYFLQTAESDRMFFFGYARLRNSRTTGVIEWFDHPNYNNGIYLDIYILDGRAETRGQNLVQVYLSWVAEKLMMSGTYHGKASAAHRLFYACLRPLSVIPLSWRLGFYNKVKSLYNKSPKAWNLNTHGDWSYRYGLTDKDWRMSTRIPFEWFDVPAPADYDRALRRIYGDYMELPPVEYRGKWHEGLVHFEPTVPYEDYFSKRSVCR